MLRPEVVISAVSTVLTARSPAARTPAPAQMCAPLTVRAYGSSALHVDLDGTRAVRRLTALPPKPEGAVRLVFVSDTHSQLSDVELPEGDILIHTGDITFCARGGLTTLQEFNEQLAALPFEHKIVIAGNHDRRLEQLGRFQARQLLTSAHYLENSGVRLCGLHFWGSPFSVGRKRRSSNRAFQYSEEFEKTRLWRYVPNDIDVLLTHGSARESVHLGAAIARTQPYVHGHGHEHEFHGATLEWSGGGGPPPSGAGGGAGGGTGGKRPHLVTVNAAICNLQYEAVQLPVTVDLPRVPSPRSRNPHAASAAASAQYAAQSPPAREQQFRRQQQQPYQRQQQRAEAKGVAVKSRRGGGVARRDGEEMHQQQQPRQRQQQQQQQRQRRQPATATAANQRASPPAKTKRKTFVPWWKKRKEKGVDSKGGGGSDRAAAPSSSSQQRGPKEGAGASRRK